MFEGFVGYATAVPHKKPNILRDFFSMSHWETALIILFVVLIFIGMHILIKKFKLKFQYRILMGLTLGIIVGIAVIGGAGFPGNEVFHKTISINGQNIPNPKRETYEWGFQVSAWLGMFADLFINGLMIMVLPIIFLSMARTVSKKNAGKGRIGAITWKGLVVLLVNVAIAFTLTFWLGHIMKIGSGFTINAGTAISRKPMKAITEIITNYMPSNFFGALSTLVVVPVLVLGALIGYAIKKSTKRHEKQMDTARENLDRYWNISLSVLMTFIKFMPFAVFAMITNAFISRPIGEFASIGGLIGLGYLGLAIMYGIHVLSVWLFGINPIKFMKKTIKPISSGFLTQSSMATLPLAIETLKVDMNMKDAEAPNIVMPLSTTVGLTGCAGVQSGVILTLLYNAKGSPVTMSIGIFFIVGLLITLFASLGIAGVPGTATIVTIGVVSTVGFPAFVRPVIGIISPLNGLFDMGRTGVNVSGGLQATVIASKLEHELPDELKIKSPFKRFKKSKK